MHLDEHERELVAMICNRMISETQRQLDGGRHEDCAGAAWHCTKLVQKKIVALKLRLDKALQDEREEKK